MSWTAKVISSASENIRFVYSKTTSPVSVRTTPVRILLSSVVSRLRSELLDLYGDGWLADVQRTGSPGEAAELRYRMKYEQPVEVDGSHNWEL